MLAQDSPSDSASSLIRKLTGNLCLESGEREMLLDRGEHVGEGVPVDGTRVDQPRVGTAWGLIMVADMSTCPQQSCTRRVVFLSKKGRFGPSEPGGAAFDCVVSASSGRLVLIAEEDGSTWSEIIGVIKLNRRLRLMFGCCSSGRVMGGKSVLIYTRQGGDRVSRG